MNIFDLFKKIESGGTSAAAPIEFLIAGLGNPGKEYERTRHNAGFVAVDAIAESLGVKIDRAKFRALIAEVSLGGKRGLLMKPQTFMNLSGAAIAEAASFYKIPPERVLVLVDDISLAPGQMRIRRKGSAGGHNGLKSIIAELGSQEFPRIKLGVGQKPSPDHDLVNWVLGKLPEEDNKAFLSILDDVAASATLIVKGDIETAMCRFSH
ncbi:MAG: aminoacyl-tRNA hydrolase [Clostridia bacterium]|nr:aminoacyl-tRNA hydrolase [Clostridia bacterium]